MDLMEARRRILMEESQTEVEWSGDGKYVNDVGEVGTNANTHYSGITDIPAGEYRFTFFAEGLSPSTYRIHEYSDGKWVAMRAKYIVQTLGLNEFTFTMYGGGFRISCPKSMRKFRITKAG